MTDALIKYEEALTERVITGCYEDWVAADPEYLALHQINGIYSPLCPKGWLKMLYTDEEWDVDAMFILDGVLNEFKVIDPAAEIQPYNCQNYYSFFSGNSYMKMKMSIH